MASANPSHPRSRLWNSSLISNLHLNRSSKCQRRPVWDSGSKEEPRKGAWWSKWGTQPSDGEPKSDHIRWSSRFLQLSLFSPPHHSISRQHTSSSLSINRLSHHLVTIYTNGYKSVINYNEIKRPDEEELLYLTNEKSYQQRTCISLIKKFYVKLKSKYPRHNAR